VKLDDLKMLKKKQKIVMLTAYDYQIAKLLDNSGIDLILVGDSLGMVVLGYKNTKEVTMQEMLHHTRAVARGAQNTPIIGDMPINSYNTVADALENAKNFLNAGAHGVKIEGNKPRVIKALLTENVPVMGHLGLTPQSIHKIGGFKVQGRTEETAKVLIEESKKLEKAGIFSLVLEAIPWKVAKKITESISIPTIGIGAGPYCDGQVLVTYDMLGYFDFKAKFVKRYLNLKEQILKAVKEYNQEVREDKFPDISYSYD